MQICKRKKRLLNIVNLLLILSLFMLTACDKDGTGNDNNKDSTEESFKEKSTLKEEDFDWVIEVDDDSDEMVLSDGSKIIGRLRMRLSNKSGKLYGTYKGESNFRLLSFTENIGDVLGQPFPMLVALDYSSQVSVCDVRVLSEEGPSMPPIDGMVELAPLVPSEDEAELAPLVPSEDEAKTTPSAPPKDEVELAPLFVSNWEGIGYNSFALSEFGSLISESTPQSDDDPETLPFILTTEGPVVTITIMSPLGIEMTFNGKMMGYGKDTKAADKPLEPFPTSEDDETWLKITMPH